MGFQAKYRGRQIHQFIYSNDGVDINDLQQCGWHACQVLLVVNES